MIAGNEFDAAFAGLTVRQKRLAMHLANGFDNRRAANRLDVSVRTIESDRRQIYEAFGVSTSVHLGYVFGVAGILDRVSELLGSN